METNLTEVYLDNSATTRCSERAKDLMVKVLMEDYGNPSSLHMKGVEAENYIKEAKKKIAKTLKVDEKEILFTSGGTESNNTALIGAALANKRAGNHIITTSIEHASVSAVTGYLEELGFRVTYLKVDESKHCTFDEQGLNAYVTRMKQMNVAEADMIGENLRLNRDGIMNQWDSFVKRGDKLLASHTILGDEGQLLQWVKWMNKACTDMSLREKIEHASRTSPVWSRTSRQSSAATVPRTAR